jgi:hypothetical protein
MNRSVPGDPVGVALVTGDLEFGATGYGDRSGRQSRVRVRASVLRPGPDAVPDDPRLRHTILPSLFSSSKLASTGEIIGTVPAGSRDAIAGTLGTGPTLIPINLKLTSDRGTTKTFKMSVVNDQLFTPLLAYVSILNTLSSYERQNGAASYAVRGSATVKKYGKVDFEDLFTGDTPSVGAATYVVGPINFLLRNAFEDVDIEGLNLEIDASEQAKTATLERVWIDGNRPKPGTTVTLKALMRTYRGEEITRSVPVEIPANARGSVSIMVADGSRLSQMEARELQLQPLQTRDLPQMIRVLNQTRKEQPALCPPRHAGRRRRGQGANRCRRFPPSVLAVMESDRNGGSFRPIGAGAARPVGNHDRPLRSAAREPLTLSLDNN